MIKTPLGWRSALAALAVAATAAAPAQAKPASSAAAAAPAQAKPASSAAASAGSAQTKTKLAQGLAGVDTSSCAEAAFSQPFRSFGDSGFYTLAPGQGVDDFAGVGWTLSDGASIETTTLDDGATGPVLTLPAGSSAVSPLMCVSSNYPTARAMIRDFARGGGVQFAVSYEGTKTWVAPQNTGNVHGTAPGNSTAWSLSHPFNLQPYHTAGWQIVRFRFTAPKQGEFQLYNLFVDPHMLR